MATLVNGEGLLQINLVHSKIKKKKIPVFEECHTPNIMSHMAIKPYPFYIEHNRRRRRGLTLLASGIILFCSTLLWIKYYFNPLEKPEELEAPRKLRKKQRIIPKIPTSSQDMPNQVPYILIGGGTASFSAFRAIKSANPTARILVVTNEQYKPYMRPPLSKEMWFNEDKTNLDKLVFKQWNGSERSLFYEPDDFYAGINDLMSNENGGVSVISGYTVTEIDPFCKYIKLDDGKKIEYEKCLIATGARPKIPPVFETALTDPEVEDRIQFFRNIDDFHDMLDSFEDSKDTVIVGGGFLGSELACGLARLAKQEPRIAKNIYQIFQEEGNMGKVLPSYLSRWTTEKVMKEGVRVVPNAKVISCKYLEKEKRLELKLNDGKTMKADNVLVAVGVVSNTQLAEKAGLEVDPALGGFLVNSELQARTDLYIAGDCACFYDPKFGRRRVEHHDHAVVTGRLAGENMTGSSKPYIHQSMFWSDLGPDVGFEAIGIVDSKLPTVGVFAKAKNEKKADNGDELTTNVPAACDKYSTPDERVTTLQDTKVLPEDMFQRPEPEEFNKGVVFYLKDDIVVGIVLWNVFNRMSIARQVLRENKKYDDLNEVAKLFTIHED